MDRQRIDKWLWAARFYKTRSIAVDEISKGRVQVNQLDAKPSREVKPGDTVRLHQGPMQRTVTVRGLSGAPPPRPTPGSFGVAPVGAMSCTSRVRACG